MRAGWVAGAAFEEDVVWQNDRGAAVLLEDGEDVLKVGQALTAALPRLGPMVDPLRNDPRFEKMIPFAKRSS